MGLSLTTVAIIIFALYILSSIKILAEYERGVIFRLGRLLPNAKGPGIILVFAPIDRMVRISLRQEALEVPPQDIITRDNVTLSRVIMSCGGTSRASCRNEIRTMRSIGANTRMMPGPFAFGSKRPRRKITPRSYSARILIELRMYRAKMMIATVVKEKPICASAPDCQGCCCREL